MGKSKRNKNAKNLAPKKRQLTPEQMQALERIIKATEPKLNEQIALSLGKIAFRFKVINIAQKVYGVEILNESSYFRKMCYEEYAFGKVFKDFGGFHTLMITKCDVWDTNWKNFIDENGNIVER